MTPSFRLLLCAAALTALSACGDKGAAPAADAPSTAASAAAAPAVAPAAAADDTASQAISMEQVDRFLAGYQSLAKAIEQDPSLEDVVSVNASEENETQHAARIAANPKAVAALAQAGTTPAEYARMQLLLPAAFFAYGMMESGALKEVPKGVDPALIDFMKANGTEVAAKMKAAGFL